MSHEPNPRTARAVLEDHLRLRREGRLEDDLRRNVAEDVVVLTCSGSYHGHEGVRRQAGALDRAIGVGSYEYKDVLLEGDVGYMEWTADDGRNVIADGADSYVIRDGRIVAQTIHYTVRGPEGELAHQAPDIGLRFDARP